MLCRIEDITKRKLKEAQLIESGQRRLALMVQQTPLAVIEWNRKFEIKEWNQAAEIIFGYSKSEVLGRDFSFLVTDDFKSSLSEMLQNFVIEKQRMFITNENITKDGRKIVCEWYNYPLIAANDEIFGIASMAFCINTELVGCKQVKISISDNGKEIPEKIKTRLFDPFFTTKPVGKGTGMGLSISYQIVVEKHCGFLDCISAPREGTEFVITIPMKQCMCK